MSLRQSPSHAGAKPRREDPSDVKFEHDGPGTKPQLVRDAHSIPDRHVVVGDRGRLVLPAAVRAELGLHAGSRLLLSTEPDGSLRLRPYRAVADSARGLLAGLGGGSMVDELTAERRAAAAAEDDDG